MNPMLYYPTQGARVYRAYLELLEKDNSLQNVRGCGLADILLLLNAYMVRFRKGDALLLTLDDLALLLHTVPSGIPCQLTRLVKAGLLGYRIMEPDVYELTIPYVERFLPTPNTVDSLYYVLPPQFLKKLDRMTFGKWHTRLDCLLDLWLHTIWNVPERAISNSSPIFWDEDCCDDDGFVDIHELGERWGFNSVLAQTNFTWLCRYVENYFETGHGYILVPRCIQYCYTGERYSARDRHPSLQAAIREVCHE